MEENKSIPDWAVDSDGDKLKVEGVYQDDEGIFTVDRDGIQNQDGPYEAWEEIEDYWEIESPPVKVTVSAKS